MTTTYAYAAGSNWPKVIVVGDPRLGDILASSGAQWVIQPVVPTVSGMWDAVETGALNLESDILIVSDGTSSQVDELEATLAAFAPFATTFLVADPSRGEQIAARARALAPTVPNGDPNAPIWILPVHDVQQALDMMKHVLGMKVTWEAPQQMVAEATPLPRPTMPSQYVQAAPAEMVAPTVHRPEPVAPVQAPAQIAADAPMPVAPIGLEQVQIGNVESVIPQQPYIPPAAPVAGQPQQQYSQPLPSPQQMYPPQYQPQPDPSQQQMYQQNYPGQPQQQQPNYAQPNPVAYPPQQAQPAYEQPPAYYEQSQVYADHVAQQVHQGVQKPPGTVPGQITIACMSSKGGSGKSTTAIMLAATIARASAAAGQPKRVVLVDLDTRDGQVGSLIGQYMPTSINIRVMPRWDAATVKANLVHDKRLGIDALLAPVRPRNADDVGPEFYQQIIGVLQTTHDVVVLDCSVNYLDPLLGTGFSMSDEILFVTTLATTSVQGMARSLTELFADPTDGGLGIPREKVGIVANQVINNVGMGRDKLLRAALGAPLVGQIPSDQDAVLIATNSNRMFDLLKHPKLGPAYFRLAVNCLPGVPLAPLTAEQAATQVPQAQAVNPDSQAGGPQKKKKGLFGR